MPPSTKDYRATWGIINLKDTCKNSCQRGERTQILCLCPSGGGSTFTRQWLQLRWIRLGLVGPWRGTAGSQEVTVLHMGTDSSEVHRKCKIKMQHWTVGTAEHFHRQQNIRKEWKEPSCFQCCHNRRTEFQSPWTWTSFFFFCFNKTWTPQHSTVSPYLQVHRWLI